MSIDPEHIEAVANALVYPWPHGAVARDEAKRLLASDSPDVHAALLAALVRAGVLTEEHRDCCSTCGLTYGSCENIDEACTDAAWTEQRRYVSTWEDA